MLRQGRKTPIDRPRDRIAAFCKRWQVTELALFGSVLRDDFGPASDVDVLAGFGECARHTLFDLDDMELELKEIFGREVDLAKSAWGRGEFQLSAQDQHPAVRPGDP